MTDASKQASTQVMMQVELVQQFVFCIGTSGVVEGDDDDNGDEA